MYSHTRSTDVQITKWIACEVLPFSHFVVLAMREHCPPSAKWFRHPLSHFLNLRQSTSYCNIPHNNNNIGKHGGIEEVYITWAWVLQTMNLSGFVKFVLPILSVRFYSGRNGLVTQNPPPTSSLHFEQEPPTTTTHFPTITQYCSTNNTYREIVYIFGLDQKGDWGGAWREWLEIRASAPTVTNICLRQFSDQIPDTQHNCVNKYIFHHFHTIIISTWAFASTTLKFTLTGRFFHTHNFRSQFSILYGLPLNTLFSKSDKHHCKLKLIFLELLTIRNESCNKTTQHPK